MLLRRCFARKRLPAAQSLSDRKSASIIPTSQATSRRGYTSKVCLRRLTGVEQSDLVGGRIYCQNCILVYMKEMLPNSDELRILSLYRVLSPVP